MKRDLTQTRPPSPESGLTSWMADLQKDMQRNTVPCTYTMEVLVNMPRPPGDYSHVDTSHCLAAAEFLQNGTVSNDGAAYDRLSRFCIENRLFDALSYLYIKSHFGWLTITPDNNDPGMLRFICKWAENTDFQINLEFTEIQHDEDARQISLLLQRRNIITGLHITFEKCSLESERDLLSSLHFNSRLEELKVTKISDGGIKMLAGVLNSYSAIRHLIIYKESLNDDIGTALFDSIVENKNLTALTIGVLDNTSRLIPVLSKAIEKNTCLKFLSLEFPEWSLDCARTFAAALEKNEHLSSLSIDSIYTYNTLHEGDILQCSFNDDAAAVLLKELASNTTLKAVRFNYCKFGDQISAALKDLISTNKTLTELNLYNCNLGSRSAKAIAEALPANTGLRSLDIGGNRHFKVDDWSQIIRSCKAPCSLTTLKLCRISNERGNFYGQYNFPVADLVEAIQSNTSLEILDLSCYSSEHESFSIDQLRQISAALESNHTLIDFIIHDEDQLTARKNEVDRELQNVGHFDYFSPIDIQIDSYFAGGSNFQPSKATEISLMQERTSVIRRFQKYDLECNEIAGKVGANAEAKRLHSGAMQGLASLVPFLPLEVTGLIVDNLILLNHEAPEESGLVAMRSLVEIAEGR